MSTLQAGYIAIVSNSLSELIFSETMSVPLQLFGIIAMGVAYVELKMKPKKQSQA